MMKKINLPTTKETFYRQFLEVLKTFPPISKLRPRELEVLAQIMLQNDKYRHLDDDSRQIIVLSTNVRVRIRESIGISEENMNNILSTLRKYKVLTKDNKLIKYFDQVNFEDGYKLEFNFIKKND